MDKGNLATNLVLSRVTSYKKTRKEQIRYFMIKKYCFAPLKRIIIIKQIIKHRKGIYKTI